MAISVKVESPRQGDVETLLTLSDATAAALYPGAYRRPLNPNSLSQPHISVFVARNDDLVAAGCCALFDSGDGTAELKRMIVEPALRQQGVGQALLRAVEASAIDKGIYLILMEVGVRNTDGQNLYRRAGFRPRRPFGSYHPSPISLFFEKPITQTG